MNQLGLYFDGSTYEKRHDQARLTGQLLRVFRVMGDARWRTLGEIQLGCEGQRDSQAAISARLRDVEAIYRKFE